MDKPVAEPPAAERVIRAVAELFFSSENQLKFHGAASSLDVSPPMLKGLLELEPGEVRTMGSLADAWGCDASFVTVTVDGLEERGLVRRRVAERDRRMKTVELTDAGAAARTGAMGSIYGPLAGFDALSPHELDTLADLLGRVAAAQVLHDEDAFEAPGDRNLVRRLTAQRMREARGRVCDTAPELDEEPPAPSGVPSGWRAQLDAQRDELLDQLRDLRADLDRVRRDVEQGSVNPVDGARLAKSEVKTAKRRVAAQAKAVKADTKAAVRRSVRRDTAAAPRARADRR